MIRTFNDFTVAVEYAKACKDDIDVLQRDSNAFYVMFTDESAAWQESGYKVVAEIRMVLQVSTGVGLLKKQLARTHMTVGYDPRHPRPGLF